MNNIIIAKLDSTYAAVYSGIWQWNYGQILRIQGGNLPKVVEVHFSLQDKGGDSITRIGTTIDGATDVPIPDSFLENGGRAQDYKIYAFIYLEDGTSGNTEYKIEMSVKSRPKPEVPGTPEEPELFRETVKAVNAAADRAEQAEQNAKASATEAGKYAASASESAGAAEKTKEDALKEVGEKKQGAIEAIQKQEETSVGKIATHTDDEIQRIQNQTADSKAELEQTITNAGVSKEEIEHSIETAGTSKTALDKSTELAGTAKTELDMSTQKAGEAKTALDGSARTAGEMQETLSATVKQAGALDTSLGEKIETGTQLKTDLTASGEKAVQDIQTAGSEQLGKMQAVAKEFTADREQITTNKEDIGSLKEDLIDLGDTIGYSKGTISPNIFDKNDIDVINGGYIGEDGNIVTNSSFNNSGFIPLELDSTYRFISNGSFITSTRICSFYDENKIFIKTASYGTPMTIKNSGGSVLRRSRYFRYLYTNAEADTLMITKNDETLYSEYIPFGVVGRGCEIVERVEALENNCWNGLKGVAFGTSLTYRSQTTGGYLQFLPQLSGIEFDNQGVGSSKIYGNAESSILNMILNYSNYENKHVAIIEGLVNDWYNSSPLGTYTDAEETTVCGCLRTAINYILTQNPNINIFVVLDHYGRNSNGADCSSSAIVNGYTQYQYYEECAKLCESMSVKVIKEYALSNVSELTPQYLLDNIHLNDNIGAMQSALTIWNEIKRFTPNVINLRGL